MRTSFLWTAFIATTALALAGLDRSAEARGERGAGYYYRPGVIVAPPPVMRYRPPPAAKPAPPAAKGPGLCGTYKYWDDGRCKDARLK